MSVTGQIHIFGIVCEGFPFPVSQHHGLASTARAVRHHVPPTQNTCN